MSRRCPNCDQRLLSDDVRCWHCDLRLEPLDDVRDDRDEAAQPSNDPFLTTYVAITVCVILAALSLTIFLGNQPQLEPFSADTPNGWTLVTDSERTFVIFLPETWRVVPNPDKAGQIPLTVAGIAHFRNALLPLSDFVEDEQRVLLAIGGQPSTFLVVGQSAILNRLSAADIARADLAEISVEGVTVLEARQIESRGTAQAQIQVLHGVDEEDGALCRQRFVRGVRGAYIFSLCAQQDALGAEAADTILSSIQLVDE